MNIHLLPVYSRVVEPTALPVNSCASGYPPDGNSLNTRLGHMKPFWIPE